ncbi:MAG: hypothetical protein RLZZ324_242 [Candidatus Parcubacteria bacterium]|jgi:endonuclease/exonuclease/phosphatase family metal-dependent hydrolase
MKKYLVLALIFASACAHELPPPVYAPPPQATVCRSERAPLQAATFNAGLIPSGQKYVAERTPFVANALARVDADVMCVQELWTDESRDAVIAASGLPYDQVFFADTVGKGPRTSEPVCTASMLSGLRRCADSHCTGKGLDTGKCVTSSCEGDLISLYLFHRKCLHALVVNAPGKTAVADMANASMRKNALVRAFDGRNGVLLLSKYPITDRQVIMLPSTGANRVALVGRVQVPGMSAPVEVACTHLSSPLSKLDPWQSGAHEWPEEQAMQYRKITDVLAKRAGGRPAIFLGDMNFGARHGETVEGVYEENMQLLREKGFTLPAASQEPPMYSQSNRNTFRKNDGPFLTRMLDQIQVRDPKGGDALHPECARRILEEPVTVVVSGEGGVETNLSDHYGVLQSFWPEADPSVIVPAKKEEAPPAAPPPAAPTTVAASELQAVSAAAEPAPECGPAAAAQAETDVTIVTP